LIWALDDMENGNAQIEVSVEEVTKAHTQKIKVFHSSILLLSFTTAA
jgi:HAUS augmin-like complex subunit 3